MANEQSETILRADQEWDIIDGELCRATNFLPLMESKVENDVVISTVKTMPYAQIIIECTKKKEKTTGFITHKMDFANLWEAFKECDLDEEKHEVLFFWTRKFYRSKIIKFVSLSMPKMIIMICPKGTYNSVESFKISPDKDIMVYVYSLMPLKFWVPEVIHKK